MGKCFCICPCCHFSSFKNRCVPLLYGAVARKEVNCAVTPLWTDTCNPQVPDAKEESVMVNIQLPGWLPPFVSQTLALRVLPETLKSSVYEVAAVAANGAVPSLVMVPPTFFC